MGKKVNDVLGNYKVIGERSFCTLTCLYSEWCSVCPFLYRTHYKDIY